MTYHTYVVTNTFTQEAIVCCARSEAAAESMGKRRWNMKDAAMLSALRVAPGSYLDV